MIRVLFIVLILTGCTTTTITKTECPFNELQIPEKANDSMSDAQWIEWVVQTREEYRLLTIYYLGRLHDCNK